MADRSVRMRVGIYADVAKEANPRGVGYHVLRLIDALAGLDGANEYLLYYQQPPWPAPVAPLPLDLPRNFRPRPIRFPASWVDKYPSVWWRHYVRWIALRDGLDVFHGPSHFVPAPSRVATVVTIHDVAYFKMDLYAAGLTEALKLWTRRSLEWSDYVIAISKNTWADLESLGVPPARLRLIYGGGNIVPYDRIAYARTAELKARFGLPDRYIVFVGTLGLRKNLQFLLRSYAALKVMAPELPHKLVLVGKPFTGFDQLEALIDELGIRQDVIVTGYVDEWQVPLFYKLADLFVLPTLYEGFTLTTIEAMGYGTPVIATDTSSIREGVGDAGILVPVDDVPALAEHMRRVLSEPGLRDALIEAGRHQARKFTWERCARETLDVYEEAFHKRRSR
jgi:glycosyltransferase involved in cell wall biosynthesis